MADGASISDDIALHGSSIGPFEFEIHVAFGSAPQFARSASDALAQDATPYTFPELKGHIAAALSQEAQSDPAIGAMMRRVAFFTRMQRFFRLALEGNLGAKFPKERLVALAQSLQAARDPTARTIRYLARPERYIQTTSSYLSILGADSETDTRP